MNLSEFTLGNSTIRYLVEESGAVHWGVVHDKNIASLCSRIYRNLQKRVIVEKRKICYNPGMGDHRAKGGFTPLVFWRVQMPSKRKKGGLYNDDYIF